MEYFKVKFFQTKGKAIALKHKLGTGDIYYYSEHSRTKDNYVLELKLRELGYFDEEYAKQFPYCVSWCTLKVKTPIK